MSILESLRTFLSAYNGMDLQTDLLQTVVGSHALQLTGQGVSFVDVLGRRQYQNNYVFFARENADNELDRRDNQDFIEDFREWLEDQEDAQNYPKLPGRYQIERIQVSNAMLFDIAEDCMGVYQVQIQVTMTKESVT